MTTQMNLKLFMVFAIVHRSKGSSNKGNLRNIDFFRSIRQRWFLNNNVCSESFIHEENRREQFFPGFHRVKCFQHDVSCNTLHACILLRFVFVLRDTYKKKKERKKNDSDETWIKTDLCRNWICGLFFDNGDTFWWEKSIRWTN